MAVHADAVRLTVYSRNHCHLCEEMIAGLRGFQAGFRFGLEIVDVGDDPALEQHYGERVPVLVYEGRELCHYHLDTTIVTALLSKIR